MTVSKSDINQIDDMLRAADATFNSGKIGETIMHLLMSNPTLSLDLFEERFRALGVKTHLVARPAALIHPPLRCSKLPNDEPAKYWLWICLHGSAEAVDTVLSDNLNWADNLSALKETGFVVADDPPAGFVKERFDA